MKKLFVSSLVVASIALTGCASIVSDSEYPVRFQSEPSAEFMIEDSAGRTVHSGRTPETVTLPASRGFFSGETYTIRYQAAGYKESAIVMKSTVDGWIVGNIIFGGILGLVIDGATGAMFALPDSNTTNLQSSDVSSIQLFDINELSDDQRTQLVSLN